MLLSFVVTYLLTRGYTRLARKTGWGSTNINGVHTHHMVVGMVVAFASGAMMFGFLPEQGLFLTSLAIAFGCGAALVLDEFALLFHLKDVYWEKEGRKSVDAVVLGVAFGSLFLLRVTPLGIDTSEPAWVITVSIILNLTFSLFAALKGKIFVAVFGVFIPVLSFIGAVRLAEPDSIWARKFYTHDANKLNRSKARYKKYEAKLRKQKERVWDFIGGKTGRSYIP